MSFEISFGLVCLGQFKSVSDQHRMVENTQTYKWMGWMGWMDGMGWLSLYDGLLRAPTVLIIDKPNLLYPCIHIQKTKDHVSTIMGSKILVPRTLKKKENNIVIVG